MFSDCCTICQTPASGFGLKSADQALRAPRAGPLSSLEKSYSIAREMPAVPWSCRIRRSRILLLFSSNLERFARQTRLSSENRLARDGDPRRNRKEQEGALLRTYCAQDNAGWLCADRPRDHPHCNGAASFTRSVSGLSRAMARQRQAIGKA